MKDFVFSPECLFVSYGFIYQKAFFVGTQHSLFVCPIEKDKSVQSQSSIYNMVEGKIAAIYLREFLTQPNTNTESIKELFARMMQENNINDKNNIR